MSALRHTEVPVHSSLPAFDEPPPPPSRRRASWLAPLLTVLCLLGVAGLCYEAAGAAAYASKLSHWARAVGVVEAHPNNDARGPGIEFYDARSHRRVYWLAPNDTDDMPPGSLGYVRYDLDGTGIELAGLPSNQAHAYESLAGLALAGAAAAAAWGLWDRRRAALADAYDDEDVAAA